MRSDVQGSAGLLERRHEERTLADALARVRAGAGSTLVLEAAGGLGKTSLLRAAHDAAAAAGMRVLRARGSELESGFPYGVVRQLFEPLLTDDEERAALLAAPPRSRPRCSVRRIAGAGGRRRAFAALHGLYWLTTNLRPTRPLVLVVDDAHWADEPSLRFLQLPRAPDRGERRCCCSSRRGP